MDEILNYERKLEDDYYQILGCSEHSTEEQILTEYKARVLDCHPDKHPGDETAAGRFQRLQTAKEVLSDPESRKKYDQWRNSGVSMTYDQWKGLRDSVHVSMHWGSVKTKPMLAEGTNVPNSSKQGETTLTSMSDTSSKSSSQKLSSSPQRSAPVWERDKGSSLLQKFRNYEV